jgi:predicted O-linked N-acetylglucosamine transferase (SPINDLY family)
MGIERIIDAAIADHQAGRHAQAEQSYRKILAQSPNHPEAMHFLGILLNQTGKRSEGTELLRRSVKLLPHHAPFHFNLGKALREQLLVDEAIAAFERATALDPKLVEAWLELGGLFRAQARLDEAIAAYARGAKLAPTSACANGLFYTLWFHPKYQPADIFNEHRRWAAHFADPLTPPPAPAPKHQNDKSPDRRLRIGYVSGDLWDHVLGRYIEPILAQHDHEHFEIFCYADGERRDSLTEKIQSHVDHWKPIVGLAHDRAAQMIRDDRIDILVDLTSHMGQGRLLMFARKPAPVQVTHLAYPATTGITAIDYRVTDEHLDPVGMTESLHTEKLVRLKSYWVYPPLAPAPATASGPSVNPLPTQTKGYVTFGALTSFTKLNDSVLQLWARILASVTDAKLHVLLPGLLPNNKRAAAMFEQNGIALARVEFIDFQSREKFLALYHDIDLSLDPFPYPGHTTSLDSLWMGVPVVTLAGRTPISRAGVSVLEHVGLGDLVAQSADQYVQIAIDLATNRDKLGELRAELRGRFLASPLADARAHTRSLEAAYRTMWSRWCNNEPPV